MVKESKPLVRIFANTTVIALPILNILYFLWHYFTLGRVYWTTYSTLSELCGFALLVGLSLFFISIFISNIAVIWRCIFAFVVLTTTCINTYILFLSIPHHVDTIMLNNRTYHLVYTASDNGYENYDLLECDDNGTLCDSIYLGVHAVDSDSMKMIGDNKKDEVHIFKDGYLIYTYGTQPRDYITNWDEIKIGVYTYYLGYYKEDQSVIYNLYECDDKFSCAKTPFQYSILWSDYTSYGFEDPELQVNNATNEVNIFYKGVLISTYGEQPRCYVEACVILEQK